MTKSCRCFWADDDGTCALGEDPPIQETCAFQEEPSTDQSTEQPPEKTWRNRA